MKKMTILFIAMFFAFMGSTFARGYGNNVDFNYFYSSLMPYGEWIEIDYDVYVWRPTSVHYSWSPYSVGRWEYTSHGWYWDSYEPFGWATYHYGRWYNDDYYGWVWMPDYEWGPSWVEWRYNDAYIGWAPLPPYASFRIGLGIHFSINWHSRYNHWNFVTYNHFHHHHINYYLVGARYRQNIFSNTKYRTNYYSRSGRIYNGGVDRDYIERRSGNRFNQRDIVSTTKLRDAGRERSGRGAIEVYNPTKQEVQRTRNVDKYNIKKSEGRTSLKRDKITVSRTTIKSERTTVTKRNITNNSRSSSKSSGREVTKRNNDRSINSSAKRGNDINKSAVKKKSTVTSRKSTLSKTSSSRSKGYSSDKSKSSRKSGSVSKQYKSNSRSSSKSYSQKSKSSSSRSKSINNSKKKSTKSYSSKSTSRNKSKSSKSSSKSRNRR